MSTVIRRLEDADVETLVAFSLRAWAPVFASLEAELGKKVYDLLFPDWRSAQANVVEATCRASENDVWVAAVDDRPVGFVAVGFIDEDATRAGEIHIIAVDPAHQGGRRRRLPRAAGSHRDQSPGRRAGGGRDRRRSRACAGPKGKKLLITVEPLGKLTPSVKDELAAQAQRIAPFRGADAGELRTATL